MSVTSAAKPVAHIPYDPGVAPKVRASLARSIIALSSAALAEYTSTKSARPLKSSVVRFLPFEFFLLLMPHDAMSRLTVQYIRDIPRDMSSTHYTKLFGSLVISTIWRAPDNVRLVWITMLALADRDGEISGSVPGLSDMARVSLEDCEDALKVLKSPDKYSTDRANDGRRIADLPDGGWLILNHAKYRAKMDRDEQREKARVRKQRQRNRDNVTETVSKVTDVTKCSTPYQTIPDQIKPPLSPKETPEKNWGIPPEDWKPMAEHMKLATKRGLDAELTAEQFRVYQQPGKVPLDWNIAFKHYVLTRFVPAKAAKAAAAAKKPEYTYKPGMR